MSTTGMIGNDLHKQSRVRGLTFHLAKGVNARLLSCRYNLLFTRSMNIENGFSVSFAKIFHSKKVFIFDIRWFSEDINHMYKMRGSAE